MNNTDTTAGIVTFADGLPGFEETRAFVIVTATTLAPFSLLKGVGDASPSFVTIDPAVVTAGYRKELGEADRARLGATTDAPLVWLALVAPQADGSATVNLRAPIVINAGSMRGIQVVPVESEYRLDEPFLVA